MTRPEYLIYAESAMHSGVELERIVDANSEVVYVFSEDMLSAAVLYDTQVGLSLVSNELTYCGRRVAVIREEGVSLFFNAALFSREFRTYMELRENSLTIFPDDGDNRLFRLHRITPAMYLDTGYTVRFNCTDANPADIDYGAAVTYAHRRLDDLEAATANTTATVTADLTRATWWDEYTTADATAATNTTATGGLTWAYTYTPTEWTVQFEDASGRTAVTLENEIKKAVKNAKRKETAFDKGGNQMLDDYLSDFRQK